MDKLTDVVQKKTTELKGFIDAHKWSENFAEIYTKHSLFLGGDKESGEKLVVKEGQSLPKNLKRADLRMADLRAAHIPNNANFSHLDLRNSDLRGVDFGTVNLNDANLRGADLRGAYLDEKSILNKITKLKGANLQGVRLYNANQNIMAVDESAIIINKRLKELGLEEQESSVVVSDNPDQSVGDNIHLGITSDPNIKEVYLNKT